MRKTFAILASAGLVFAGCTQDLTPTPPQIEDEVTTEITPRNVENAVYNPLTDMWMIPQNDPYTLENFQQAYDNIAAGKSLQTLTRTEAAEFSEGEQLEPTHFALRIYPKTEDEQWKVEMMEDVNVVYSPFNYSGLTEEEAAQVPQTRAEIASPFEVSPYTVTYDYTEATDGGPTGSVTYQLPVLYAVWPASKPLPEDLEYKVDYGVFLPHEAPATRSVETMQLLEIEAISLAFGLKALPARPETRATTRAVTGITGTLKAYDDVLKKNVPIGNALIILQNGTYIQKSSYPNGYFTFVSPLGSIFRRIFTHSLSVVFRDPEGRWKITSDGNTIPSWGRNLVTKAFVTNNFGEIVIPPQENQILEIHRAVNYFFNEQTDFPTTTPSGGITIVANSTGNTKYEGLFLYDRVDKICEIDIYNNDRSNSSVIGMVLHELGHMAHYMAINSGDYKNTHALLQESFASYSGWYFGEAYYKSLGWVKPTGYSDITGNARQEWYKELGVTVATSNQIENYSPLFIDLTDTFDQSVLFNYSTERPNDWIESVSPSVVWNIITTSRDWAQCKSNLQRYVAMPDELRIYLLTAGYDYWFRYN